MQTDTAKDPRKRQEEGNEGHKSGQHGGDQGSHRKPGKGNKNRAEKG